MSKESTATAEARQHLYGGRLPLFDQIAHGFIKCLAAYRQEGEPRDCLNYLDGKLKIDGTACTRRTVVLAIEDLKQQIEAPLPLRSEVYTQMKLLKLDPVPELKLYRDLATAILRIDAALHLSKMSKARSSGGWQPIYH